MNTETTPRRPRSDARRNVSALLEAAKAVFAESGVDAPVREIAARAGVGVGTVYRHFPQRSDLVVAVFRTEIDACAASATEYREEFGAGEKALRAWLHRYSQLIATKHGLAAALHSGDPAFLPLPGYFSDTLGPALDSLLQGAVAAGQVRGDVTAYDLISVVRDMSSGPPETVSRMVDVFADGLRAAR